MALAFAETRPPLPPVELVQRVVPPFAAGAADHELMVFDAGGQHSVRCLEHGLAAVGREWTSFERLLDFGCGPGRVLRWLGPLKGAVELHGMDVDPDPIAWADANIPYASFLAGPHEPPTAYPDGYFDLVINHSVFTHLDERMQDLWLAELRRIVRPGGTLLLTVHSAPQVRAFYDGMRGAGADPEPYRAQLERDGILFIREDHYLGSAHPDFYHSTFHAPWYLFEHWHGFFDIRAYLPEGADTQDLLVLERRPDDAEVPRPVGHGATARATPTDAPATAPAALARSLARQVARRALAAVAGGSAAGGDRRRQLVLEDALRQQGERITLLQRDLRAEIEALRRDSNRA